jgi:hypothetical protein
MHEVMVEEESKEGLNYYIISFRSQEHINTMLNGTRAT